MATAPTLKTVTPIIPATPLDPVAQKLADLEARLATLESVLSVNASGVVTLKSASTSSSIPR